MSGAHVVVVDDEPDLRAVVARYLLKHGFSVSEAEGGAGRRALMAERAVDLVVLDVNMPGRTGCRSRAICARGARWASSC